MNLSGYRDGGSTEHSCQINKLPGDTYEKLNISNLSLTSDNTPKSSNSVIINQVETYHTEPSVLGKSRQDLFELLSLSFYGNKGGAPSKQKR